jgi:hypothetical protein
LPLTGLRVPNGAQRRGYTRTERMGLRFIPAIHDSQLTSYLINLAT